MTLLSLCIPGRPALRPRRDLALQALVLAALATPLMLQAAVLKLRLLETTDLHMNLLNYDYYQDKLTDDYGLAKSITLIKAARAEAKNSLLFGHSHGEFPGAFFAQYPKVDLARGTIDGVPAVMPGRWGDHLGVIDLVLDNTGGAWKITDSRAALRPITDRATRKPLVAADPMVAALIAEEHAATLAYVRGPVTTTRSAITSYFAQVADDPSVQIISQAQLAYAKRALQGTEFEGLPLLSAAAPFKAGGRQGWNHYTDIPAGTLSIRHVADLYIYPKTPSRRCG